MTTPKAEAGDYVLVPVEPTAKMVQAVQNLRADQHILDGDSVAVTWYRAMLSAAPPSPSVADGRMRDAVVEKIRSLQSTSETHDWNAGLRAAADTIARMPWPTPAPGDSG